MDTIDVIGTLEDIFIDRGETQDQTLMDVWDATLYYTPILVHAFQRRMGDERVSRVELSSLSSTATILLFDLFCGHDIGYAIKLLPHDYVKFGLTAATFKKLRHLLIVHCMDVLEEAVMTFDWGLTPWKEETRMYTIDLLADEAI